MRPEKIAEHQSWLHQHGREELMAGAVEAPNWAWLQTHAEGTLSLRQMMYFPEREEIVRLARTVAPGGLYVEIGCSIGATTSTVALANPELRCVVIDPLDDPPDDSPIDILKINLTMNGVADRVIIMRARSQDLGRFWATPIDFLVVDGDHTEEACYQDCMTYAPWLWPGGILLVDDIHGKPVMDGWQRFMAARPPGEWSEIWRDSKLVVLQREKVGGMGYGYDAPASSAAT